MKAFGLLFLLVPALSFGAVSQSVITPAVKTYTCMQYTDNEVSSVKGFLTDNEPQDTETTIVQRDNGFEVKPGDLFPEGKTFSNQLGGPGSTLGTNKEAMLFKQYNDKGNAYFIVYLFDKKDDPKANIGRALVFAACATN
jgi:hypothetical protein